MRIGQLARKLDLPIQEIITCLEATGENLKGLHANTSLTEEQEDMLLREFDPNYSDNPEVEEMEPLVETAIKVEEEVKEDIEEPLVSDIEPKEANDQETVKNTPVEEKNEEVAEEEPAVVNEATTEEKVIATDQLIEMLESEEIPAELDEITLIKAPKKELEGLKVVGKIDLPEPKPKPEDKEESESDKPRRSGRNKRHQKREISEEERRQRQLKARKRKEAAAARKEAALKKKKEEETRAKKAEHYRKRVVQKAPKPVSEKKPPRPIRVMPEIKEEPVVRKKSVFGRFWSWLNAHDD